MESVSGVGVLDKTMLLLDALARGPADLADVQARCGLPRATAHRLLVAMEAHRLVRRDPGGRFCLGFELVRLGQTAATWFPLGEIARPILEALRAETGESAQLFVPEGQQRRCVVSLPSHHALRWTVPEGSLLPMDRGSAGKVLAEQARLADSVAEREAGVASVSAAVTSAGRVVAAVGISGPIERLTKRPAVVFGDAVSSAAAALTSALAATYHGAPPEL